jgi:hypothetical protein
MPAMTRLTALVLAMPAGRAQAEALRATLVCACAAALILAGQALPVLN